VAGAFYRADADQLRATLADCERAAVVAERDARPLRALIAPHAGYVYSGPIAASAYRLLDGAHGRVRRVILIGPSHFVPLAGLALPTVEAFETPFGLVPIDEAARKRVLKDPAVILSDRPHAHEHSLEVQVPFLQSALGDFELVPLAAGDASAEEVGRVLECAWDPDDTLLVVSTDLSHYHDYATARQLDTATARAIVKREREFDGEQACGCVGISGVLDLARRRNLDVRLLDLRNSGDTAGDRSRVVGYGAFALYEGPFPGSRPEA
jgi:AmmeMemoRadiSam system protein B